MRRADRNTVRATVATIVCHVIWGFSFLASRRGLSAAPVFVLLSHRFLPAFLLMSLLPGRVRELRTLRRRELLWLLALGLMEPVLYFFGEQYGLLHSNTVFSGVMIAMIPVAAALAAVPILRERLTPGQLLFSLLSVSGVVGMGLYSSSSGVLDALGVGMLLLAVFSAAGYSLLTRRLSAQVSASTRAYAIIAVGAAVFTPLALLQSGGLAGYLRPLGQPGYVASVAFLAAGCSVLSYFLSGYALTHLSVARESVYSNLTTAVSVFAGVVFLREPFSRLSLVCCALILIGIYGVQRCTRT